MMIIFQKSLQRLLLISCLAMSGCEALKESPKYDFNEGYYDYKEGKEKYKKEYVVARADSVKIYEPSSIQQSVVDTIQSISIAFPQNKKPLEFKEYKFRKNSMDINVITIVAKCHPGVKDFPVQLISSFNGAAYLGYRYDIYELTYNRTPLKVDKRETEHHGYSLGAFLGFASEHIDQYVTRGGIDYEYEGLVIQGGGALILALNRLNFGLAAGTDYLPDQNKKTWIYQLRPWLGISVGINIEK